MPSIPQWPACAPTVSAGVHSASSGRVNFRASAAAPRTPAVPLAGPCPPLPSSNVMDSPGMTGKRRKGTFMSATNTNPRLGTLYGTDKRKFEPAAERGERQLTHRLQDVGKDVMASSKYLQGIQHCEWRAAGAGGRGPMESARSASTPPPPAQRC